MVYTNQALFKDCERIAEKFSKLKKETFEFLFDIICRYIEHQITNGKACSLTPLGKFTFHVKKIDTGTQGILETRYPVFIPNEQFTRKYQLKYNNMGYASNEIPVIEVNYMLVAQRATTVKDIVITIMKIILNRIGEVLHSGKRVDLDFRVGNLICEKQIMEFEWNEQFSENPIEIKYIEQKQNGPKLGGTKDRVFFDTKKTQALKKKKSLNKSIDYDKEDDEGLTDEQKKLQELLEKKLQEVPKTNKTTSQELHDQEQHQKAKQNEINPEAENLSASQIFQEKSKDIVLNSSTTAWKTFLSPAEKDDLLKKSLKRSPNPKTGSETQSITEENPPALDDSLQIPEEISLSPKKVLDSPRVGGVGGSYTPRAHSVGRHSSSVKRGPSSVSSFMSNSFAGIEEKLSQKFSLTNAANAASRTSKRNTLVKLDPLNNTSSSANNVEQAIEQNDQMNTTQQTNNSVLDASATSADRRKREQYFVAQMQKQTKSKGEKKVREPNKEHLESTMKSACERFDNVLEKEKTTTVQEKLDTMTQARVNQEVDYQLLMERKRRMQTTHDLLLKQIEIDRERKRYEEDERKNMMAGFPSINKFSPQTFNDDIVNTPERKVQKQKEIKEALDRQVRNQKDSELATKRSTLDEERSVNSKTQSDFDEEMHYLIVRKKEAKKLMKEAWDEQLGLTKNILGAVNLNDTSITGKVNSER